MKGRTKAEGSKLGISIWEEENSMKIRKRKRNRGKGGRKIMAQACIKRWGFSRRARGKNKGQHQPDGRARHWRLESTLQRRGQWRYRDGKKAGVN